MNNLFCFTLLAFVSGFTLYLRRYVYVFRFTPIIMMLSQHVWFYYFYENVATISTSSVSSLINGAKRIETVYLLNKLCVDLF